MLFNFTLYKLVITTLVHEMIFLQSAPAQIFHGKGEQTLILFSLVTFFQLFVLCCFLTFPILLGYWCHYLECKSMLATVQHC